MEYKLIYKATEGLPTEVKIWNSVVTHVQNYARNVEVLAAWQFM